VYGPRVRRELGRGLAAAFLAGTWSERAMAARGRRALAPAPRFVPHVAREVLAAYRHPPRDRPRELAAYVAEILAPLPPPPVRPRVVRWYVPEPAMARTPWPVPELASTGALAAFLGLDDTELDWLADARGLERRAPDEKLRNYRYDWHPRPSGLPRLIERPKARLKAAQRRLLDDLLVWIPPHDAAHGFVRGRSARTHAAAHVGAPVVVCLDLEDFFATVEAGRVYGIFRTAGYPESVAHLLTALTTNAIPHAVWAATARPAGPGLVDAHHRLGRRLAAPHLPQGAPTSPALANLCAFRLDRRLAGLARAIGATYTRYADDLTFSGDERLLGLAPRIASIARSEGFRVNERKTRRMSRARRQRVTGIVVNERLNVARHDYDALKAALHNAATRGPEAENRAGVPDFRAHLLGRIAWVESLHPARGAELRRRFARITWEN
jgi:RNA-directed DNA polymerase